jgi:signal transduction histidine kinase
MGSERTMMRVPAIWLRTPWWLFLLAGAALLIALALQVAQVYRGPTHPAAQHLVQVEHLALSDAAGFAPLSRSEDTALPEGPWHEVALPYLWRPNPYAITAGSASPPPVETLWLRARLQPPADGATPYAQTPQYLYLPRWQAKGRIAVYADDRLVYHSRGEPAFSAFNHPQWIALDADGMRPPAQLLRVRIDRIAGTASAVSSLWAGPAPALLADYQMRRWLQIGLPQAIGVAMLGLGGFALVVWLFRRHDHLYVLFAVFSILWALRSLRFYVGLVPLDMPAPWFQWMNINAANALLVTWYAFMRALLPAVPRWPLRVIGALAVVAAVATLPPVSGLPLMALLARGHILVALLGGVPLTLLAAWVAWRHGSTEARVAAGAGLLHLPILAHDFLLESLRISPESLYALPLSAAARLLAFTYIMFNRYVGAMHQADEAGQQLAQRLQAREAELAQTYAQLRAADREQTLGEERHRLMQDIHDGMGSQLIAALQAAEQGRLDEAQMAAILRECMDDLRLTVDSLEPVEAELLMLLATLRFRMGQRLEAAGLRLRWEVSDVPALPWLDPRAALQILRILQEAMGHVLHRGQATELRVSTGTANGGVFVALQGNDADATLPRASTTPSLETMARRAQALDGRVVWGDTPDGTRCELWLPLQREAL